MCETALQLQHVPILLHNVTYHGWSANVCTLHDHWGNNLKCDVALFLHIQLSWIATCCTNLKCDTEKLSYPHALAGGYHPGLVRTWDWWNSITKFSHTRMWHYNQIVAFFPEGTTTLWCIFMRCPYKDVRVHRWGCVYTSVPIVPRSHPSSRKLKPIWRACTTN